MLTNALRKRELNNDPNYIRKRGLNNDNHNSDKIIRVVFGVRKF